MKTLQVLTILALVVFAGTATAFAVEQIAPAPSQTMAEFQRLNAGTKPVVSAFRYQESKYVEKLPRTTLSVSRLRLEIPSNEGTKPGIVQKHGTRHTWNLGRAVTNKPSVRA